MDKNGTKKNNINPSVITTQHTDKTPLRARIENFANQIRPHYSSFLNSRNTKILLTGHSHQAWPDTAKLGILEAWQDAVELVDQKWRRITQEIIPEFQRHTAKRIGSSRPDDLAIAPNAHELIFRLVSCFPRNGAILISDSEFYSASRQLKRLAEDGQPIIEIATSPTETFAERLIQLIKQQKFSLIILSWVLFKNALILPKIEVIAQAAAQNNTPLLLDAYHAYNVLPIEADQLDGQTFIVAGGYKYAQSGEGCCFMLLPKQHVHYRPLQTGWFASNEPPSNSKALDYGPGGQRFFGSTFDPTSFYRANHVMRWMDQQHLDPYELRRISLERTEYIIQIYNELKLDQYDLQLASPANAQNRAGFVAFKHPKSQNIIQSLKAKNVYVDGRDQNIRIGPAPYTNAQEIEQAMEILLGVTKAIT